MPPRDVERLHAVSRQPDDFDVQIRPRQHRVQILQNRLFVVNEHRLQPHGQPLPAIFGMTILITVPRPGSLQTNRP